MKNIELEKNVIERIFNTKNWQIIFNDGSAKGYYIKCNISGSSHLYFLTNGKFAIYHSGAICSNKRLKQLGLDFVDDIDVTSSGTLINYHLYYHPQKENIISFLNEHLNINVFKKEDLNLLRGLNEKS